MPISLSKKRFTFEQLLAYAILTVVGVIMVSTVWPSLDGNGYLAAWDAGGHLLKAEYFAKELLAHGQLDGWFPTWHGGFGLFQYYPPLLYYLLGPLTYVFHPEFALRLFTAALWVGLLPATYYLLRSFSLERLPAALGSGLLLSLNASFGIGLGALYGVGLLPNGLGFVLAIWTLGRLKRDLFDLRGTSDLVVTGLVFGLLVLAHTFSTYWFLLASVVLVVCAAWGRRWKDVVPVLKRYGLVLGLGLVLSAYWWIPLLGSFDGMGETGAIQQLPAGEILRGLLLSQDSGGWPLSVLAVGGLAYLWFRRRFRELGFFLGTGALTLLLSINAINGLLPFGGVVGSSQFIRFHAFFALLMMVLAAFGVAGALALLARLPRRYRPVGIAASLSAVVLLANFFVLPTLREKAGFIRVVDNQPTAELQELAGQLERRIGPGEFVLSEFNWESRYFVGSPHFANQRLPRELPGVWDLDGNFPEGTKGSARPVLIASTLGNGPYLGSQEEYLRRRGIKYVISTFPLTRGALDAQEWLRPAWKGRIFSLYEVRGFDRPFGLPPDAGTALTSAEFARGTYRLKFDRPVTIGRDTALAVSYHPWLVVRSGKEEVRTGDSNDQLTLTEPVVAKELTVSYEPPGWVRGSWTVSVLGLIGLAVLLGNRRRITAWLKGRATGRRERRTARRR
ncbi:MAG TPA: DUF6541 family protein [Patescibacteria group bacterium]